MNETDQEKRLREELKAERERHDRLVSVIIVGVILAIIAFAVWNNHRINGNTNFMNNAAPTCDEQGTC